MTEKLWGARFEQDISKEVLEYTATIDIDSRLIRHDLWQSLAHVLMLAGQQIIQVDAARQILGVLLELWDRYRRGELVLRLEYEDVHLNIEHEVVERLGLDIGGRMHTARSRNDQVATDTRMYLKETQIEAVRATADLIDVLLGIDDGDYTNVIPGYTHSQAAQPVTVAFWRVAHASAMLRDIGRLQDAYRRTDICPLGGGALAGTSFPIDRALVARLLGFDQVLSSALDATSTRDFVIETAAAFAIAGTGLSRLAEEIVVWSGNEFRLCQVADEFATGSSIMPQKKNPVVAELVRGRTGRLTGTLVQLLTMVKGVSLGYSCDLQEDKPYLWDGIDTYLTSVRILTGQTRKLQFDPDRGEQLCWDNFSTATELANHLVRERGMSFRDAYTATGRVVRQLIEQGMTLRRTDAVAKLLFEGGHPVDKDTLRRILDPRSVVASCSSVGGTAPASVRSTAQEVRSACTKFRTWADQNAERLASAQDRTVRMARALANGASVSDALGSTASD